MSLQQPGVTFGARGARQSTRSFSVLPRLREIHRRMSCSSSFVQASIEGRVQLDIPNVWTKSGVSAQSVSDFKRAGTSISEDQAWNKTGGLDEGQAELLQIDLAPSDVQP